MKVMERPEVKLIAHDGGDESVLAAMLVSTQSEREIKRIEG